MAEFPATEDTMTEEEIEYLRWYYRTEDGEYAPATSIISNERYNWSHAYTCI